MCPSKSNRASIRQHFVSGGLTIPMCDLNPSLQNSENDARTQKTVFNSSGLSTTKNKNSDDAAFYNFKLFKILNDTTDAETFSMVTIWQLLAWQQICSSNLLDAKISIQ